MPRLADRRARIELLRAAEAAFTERGLAATKVEDITGRAGVSKGAFYLHFDSKDDCFKQIVETFIARLAICVELPVDIFDIDPSSLSRYFKRLVAHDIEVLEFCWQNRGLLRMMLAGGGGAPYSYLIDEFAQRVARQVEGRIRHAMDIGLYRRDISPTIVTALISGAFDRLVRELIQAPSKPDIPSWCVQILQFFTQGLLTPEARAVADLPVTNADLAIPDDTQHAQPQPKAQTISAPPASKPPGRRKRTKPRPM